MPPLDTRTEVRNLRNNKQHGFAKNGNPSTNQNKRK